MPLSGGSGSEGATYTGDKTIVGSLTLPAGTSFQYEDGLLDVRAFGAVGDGVVNDTAAIQAAIDATPDGGPVWFPAGTYRIMSTLTLQPLTQLLGVGYNRYATADGVDLSRIDASGIGNIVALQAPASSRHLVLADLALVGPGGDVTTSTGFAAYAGAELRVDNVYISGFGSQLYFDSCQGIVITRAFLNGAAGSGLTCTGCSVVHVSGSQIANAIGGGIRLLSGTESVMIDLPIMDEGGDDAGGTGNLLLDDAHNVIFRCPLVYLSRGCYTIRITSTCANIGIYDCHIGPFTGDRVPLTLIKIEAGATGVRLVNVTTSPNGGGDIDDGATDTLYLGVNGMTKHPVVATASLPAAAAAQDGRILIEDAGAGNRNLIVYAGGQRFRIDGGANV